MQRGGPCWQWCGCFRKAHPSVRAVGFPDKASDLFRGNGSLRWGASHWPFLSWATAMGALDVATCVRHHGKVHGNDDRGAEAISGAAKRPALSFIAVGSEEQLDLQALHRLRERLVHDRTRLINQARGFVIERGVGPASGYHVFRKALAQKGSGSAGGSSRRRAVRSSRGLKCGRQRATDTARAAKVDQRPVGAF